MHLKSSSGERECVGVGPIAQCVRWVLPDVRLCSSRFTAAEVAVPQRQPSPEAALCAWAEITLQVKLRWEFPSGWWLGDCSLHTVFPSSL